MERSRWSRWTKRVKQFFRLDPSLTLNDPDYYTAIYSANIPRFEELFETLRGSKDLYFTPTERSLLTHELLSRAHFDYEEEEEYNASKALAQTASSLAEKRHSSISVESSRYGKHGSLSQDGETTWHCSTDREESLWIVLSFAWGNHHDLLLSPHLVLLQCQAFTRWPHRYKWSRLDRSRSEWMWRTMSTRLFVD